MSVQRGIELGIKANMDAILKASKLADDFLDYFLVPETNPKIMGVDALEAVERCSETTKRITLGTGIINVFSRDKTKMLDEAVKVYKKTGGRFVLGLGTSAPIIVSKTYGLKFEKPVSRILEYTKFLEERFDGSIFWAAVGPKMLELAARNADGVLFFLKPRKNIIQDIKKVRQVNSGKSFQVASIVPTFVDEHIGIKLAKRTLAGYIGANEFYSKPLEMEGYDVSKIKREYDKFGLGKASMEVSEEMVKELTVFGKPDECVESMSEYQKKTGVDTVIAGFDMRKEEFDSGFFNRLGAFITGWAK